MFKILLYHTVAKSSSIKAVGGGGRWLIEEWIWIHHRIFMT